MHRRAILVFARNPRAEAAAKGLPQLEGVFAAVEAGWCRAARACGASPIIACAQRGATFGERLYNAADDAFGAGFETLLITGIDVPPLDSLSDAFVAAEQGAVVIAPSTDGGINAIVLQRRDASILAAFAPRDPRLLARCIEQFGDRVVLLDACTDIDSAHALRIARLERLWRPYLVVTLPAFEDRIAVRHLVVRATRHLRAPPFA